MSYQFHRLAATLGAIKSAGFYVSPNRVKWLRCLAQRGDIHRMARAERRVRNRALRLGVLRCGEIPHWSEATALNFELLV
jgi:hypothetical protein